jgi:hypothetical protein
VTRGVSRGCIPSVMRELGDWINRTWQLWQPAYCNTCCLLLWSYITTMHGSDQT